MGANIEYLKQQIEIKRAEYELARLNLENASKSPLIQLPPDVFCMILFNLSLFQLWKLRGVSKKFHQAYWNNFRKRYRIAVDKLTYGKQFRVSTYWKCMVIKKTKQKNGLFLHYKDINCTNGQDVLCEEVRKGKLKINKQYQLMCSYIVLDYI